MLRIFLTLTVALPIYSSSIYTTATKTNQKFHFTFFQNPIKFNVPKSISEIPRNLGSSNLLHLCLGAILSLATILLRTYLPIALTRPSGETGRAEPHSYQMDLQELGRWIRQATDDPLAPALNAMMETSIKNKLKVNATDVEWLHPDCGNQLLCQTVQEASSSHGERKIVSILRAIILLSTLQQSFSGIIDPVATGYSGNDCSKQFPKCEL